MKAPHLQMVWSFFIEEKLVVFDVQEIKFAGVHFP